LRSSEVSKAFGLSTAGLSKFALPRKQEVNTYFLHRLTQAATIPLKSTTFVEEDKSCVLQTRQNTAEWKANMKIVYRLESSGRSPMATPTRFQTLQHELESYMDLEPFLTGDKMSVSRSPLETSALVNKDHDILNDDEPLAKTFDEVNYEEAWALLKEVESFDTLDQFSTFDNITSMQTNLADSQATKQLTGNMFDNVDTPVLMSNLFDLPYDINTPDVDITMLTKDVPEIFSSAMEDHSPVEESYDVQNAIQEVPEFECVLPTEPESPASPESQILTLNIGQNNENAQLGKGAQLQLKRKATNNPLVEVQTVESVQPGTNDRVMTIVINLGNGLAQESISNVIITNNEPDSVEPPPAKKARHEEVEDKYNEMRRKNNEASRRCRQTRKQKQSHMADLAEQLEKENKELQCQVVKLESQIQEIKSELIKVFQSKNV